MKAISKGYLAGCLVLLDVGSTNRLDQQLPLLLKNPNCQPLIIAPGVTPKRTQQRCTQSSQAQCQHEGDTPC